MTDKDTTTALGFSAQLRERVLAAAKDPRTVEELGADLGITDLAAFESWLEHLARKGYLQRIKRKRYQNPGQRVVAGMFRRGRYGAYVVADDRQLGEISVPEAFTEGAQDGDRVLIAWRRERPGKKSFSNRGGGVVGKVLNIVVARRSEIVGVFERSPYGNPRVRLEGYDLPHTARLPESETGHLKPGTIVKVKLSRKPGHEGEARAELLGSIGTLKNPLEDLDNLCSLFGFAREFSDETREEVEALPAEPEPRSFKGRLDLRELPVITIDPKDAKDHDDAVSVEVVEGGLIKLGVHIADVAHYVRPGTALDREAQERATSVYLPGRTIPMLPEKLSAGLCSLMDKRDRLAKSCFMWFDSHARCVRREVVNSVIRVRRYLTYEQVLPVLVQVGATSGDDVVDYILFEAKKLAVRLRQRRMDNGALVLEIPRAHVIVGRDGLATEIKPETHDISHNLIEECMLAANQAVAAFLLDRGLPYLGRVHPPPDQDDREAFWELCDELRLPRPDFDRQASVQAMLDKLRGVEGADAVHYALLRSMKRAVYAPEPELHYALNMTKYVHFTSPIRRYPDTVVHQLLDAYLATGARLRFEDTALGLPWADGSLGDWSGEPPRDGRKLPRADAFELLMPGIAAHSTERAIRADQGEIAANQIKILRTLLGHEGEEHRGTVVTVLARGVIVRLDGCMAEGLVDYRDLTDGWVENHKFWAQYETPEGYARIMTGDRMEVEIKEIDLGSRSLTLTPLGEHEKSWTKGKPRHKKFEPAPRRSGRGRRR